MPRYQSIRGSSPRRRRLILASGSPRRRRLIRAIDIPVRIVESGDDEPEPLVNESPKIYVQRLALQKAKYALKQTERDIVLGADTSVAIDRDILGKPRDAREAARMLEQLRGRPHEVVTGVALMDADTGICTTSAKVSRVYMRGYSDQEISAYIASGEPFDKAGAYAAQDETFRPANQIEGCYPNVIGLPLCEVLTLLDRIGVPTTFKRGWTISPGCPDCDYWSEITSSRRKASRQ